MGILIRCRSVKYRSQSGTTFPACFCSLPLNPRMEIRPTVSRTDSQSTNKCAQRTWNLILVTPGSWPGRNERKGTQDICLFIWKCSCSEEPGQAVSVLSWELGGRQWRKQDQEQFALSGLQSPFIWRCGHYHFGFLTVPWIAPYFSRGKPYWLGAR